LPLSLSLFLSLSLPLFSLSLSLSSSFLSFTRPMCSRVWPVLGSMPRLVPYACWVCARTCARAHTHTYAHTHAHTHTHTHTHTAAHSQGAADGDGAPPRRATLPASLSLGTITLAEALTLLAPPMTLGAHPDDDEPITLGSGRFWPFVKHRGVFAAIPKAIDPEAVSLDQAVELIAAKVARLRAKGVDPYAVGGAFAPNAMRYLLGYMRVSV